MQHQHHLENQSDFGKLPWTNQERYTHTTEYFAIPGVMEINPKEFHAVMNSPGSLTSVSYTHLTLPTKVNV